MSTATRKPTGKVQRLILEMLDDAVETRRGYVLSSEVAWALAGDILAAFGQSQITVICDCFRSRLRGVVVALRRLPRSPLNASGSFLNC